MCAKWADINTLSKYLERGAARRVRRSSFMSNNLYFYYGYLSYSGKRKHIKNWRGSVASWTEKFRRPRYCAVTKGCAPSNVVFFFPLHGARASSFRMIIPGSVLDGRERISVCVPRSRVQELGSFLILKSARKLALPKQSEMRQQIDLPVYVRVIWANIKTAPFQLPKANYTKTTCRNRERLSVYFVSFEFYEATPRPASVFD